MHEFFSCTCSFHLTLSYILSFTYNHVKARIAFLFRGDPIMSVRHIDVLAVGNAIVDIFCQCDDNFLVVNKIEKGVMTLLDSVASAKLFAAISKLAKPQLISGGSAANTAVGMANFGGKANFVGRVNDDDLGVAFRHDLIAAGVGFDNPPARSGSPTASSIILVTPDAARSMNTYLGASIEFEALDLRSANVEAAKIIYLEGYLFDAPNGPAIFDEAARLAQLHGAMVALSLSDPWCAERHRAALRDFTANHVSILFGNEEEVACLYQCEVNNAISALSDTIDEVIVTRGPKGAFVGAKQNSYEIPAMLQGAVIDTTGAGDLFAAGYLFGRTNGFNLLEAGRLASLAAGEAISHVGARPKINLKELSDRL
jgi:sugar/nucleoside kinase (ribokinase family)